MDVRGPSKTAEGCAAIRASHFLHGERPLVFEDPVAIELIRPEERERCLSDKEISRHDAAGIILCRSRYTEDLLEEAVRSGVEQYVLLGAGLDTFALRRSDLLAKMRVYEIDEGATQGWKRERLAQIGREAPASLEFVAVDFERESVTDGLARCSYRSDRPAFFSWLGTLPYLSREAIMRTLEALAAASAPGSEIVLDYKVAMEFLDPQDVPLVQEGDRGTAQGGEPKQSWLNPYTFPQEVCALGFELVESLWPRQMEERYFAGRTDLKRLRSHIHYAHFRRRG